MKIHCVFNKMITLVWALKSYRRRLELRHGQAASPWTGLLQANGLGEALQGWGPNLTTNPSQVRPMDASSRKETSMTSQIF